LSACGGGGGGSAGPTVSPTPGGPVNTTTLDVSSTAVRFEGRQFQDIPAPQGISISASGASVSQIIAGYAPGVTPPDWLGVEFSGTASAATLTLSITRTDFAFQTYTVPLRVVTATSADVVIDTVDVNVTFVLEQGKQLTVNKSEITALIVPDDGPATETLTISATGLRDGETINWARTFVGVVFEQEVSLDIASGTLAQGESQIVQVTIPELVTGTGAVPIDLGVDADARGASVTVRARSIDGLTSDPRKLDVLLEESDTTISSTTVTLIDTQTQTATASSWSATADQTWVSLEELNASDVRISVDPTTLVVGQNNAFVSVSHDISEQVLRIPVRVFISAPSLTLSQKGVALSNLSTLTRDVTVTDSKGMGVSWDAATSEGWLNVTPTGAAGDPLTLTADATGLTMNTLFETTVTVSSPDLVEPTEMAVGFWVGDSAQDRVSFNIDPAGFGLGRGDQSVAVDPIRPYAYVKTERPNSVRVTNLDTYNIYTGQKVGETMEVEIASGGDIVVSDDGQYLFITNSDGTQFDLDSLVKIKLADKAVTSINLSAGTAFADVVYARVKSQGVLISSRGQVMDVEAESVIATLPVFDETGTVRISQNGRAICTAADANFGGEFACNTLKGTGFVDGPIQSSPLTQSNIMAGSFRLGAVFEISNDGENLIFQDAQNTGDDLRSVKLSDQTETFTTGVQMTDIGLDLNDRIFVATFGDTENLKVIVYSPDGMEIASDSYSTSDRTDSADQIYISGDQSRVIQLLGGDLFVMPVPAN
jgi:hypothetical protein